MGLADLHVHSTHSWDGTCTVEGILRQASHHSDLDVIAITDHDAIDGALEAREIGPRYGIEVVPGIEISTQDGHLLALYVDRLVPPGHSLRDTIQRVGELGGICAAPHPLENRKNSVGAKRLIEVMQLPGVDSVLVGVEVLNGGPLTKTPSGVVSVLAEGLALAEVGSSDSHVVWTIGCQATVFDGSSAMDLRHALERGVTDALQIFSPRAIDISASWLKWRLLRSVGWPAAAPMESLPVFSE